LVIIIADCVAALTGLTSDQTSPAVVGAVVGVGVLLAVIMIVGFWWVIEILIAIVKMKTKNT
jgi:hypothetical protein